MFYTGGGNIKKEKYKNIDDWFPIKQCKSNVIVSKDSMAVKIIKVEPINFKLKSPSEQMAILEAYKNFLKSCNFDMQIIIQTENIDIEKHLNEIKTFIEEEKSLSGMAQDYVDLIKYISKKRESISRKFYIAISNKIVGGVDKIITSLSNCGNIVEECSEAETLDVLNRYFKNTFSKRKEAKWV